MSHIKTIEIKNFKSIRHQKIENCRRVNVFIGYPNVGKSNILEALGLFSVGNDNLKKIVRLKEDPTIFFDGLIDEPISVLLNKEYLVEGSFKKNEFSLSCKFLNEESISKETGLLQSARELYTYRFRAFAFSTLIKFDDEWKTGKPDVKKYEFKKEIAYNSSNYSTLDYPFGENIFSILNTNRTLKKDAAELLKEYNLEFLYNTSDQKFAILKRISSGIFTVPYELIADTLQRLIFYKAAIQTNSNAVLLFEEPEAHMFPPYIAKFTTDIIFDEQDNQYFIATHSPFVVNEFMEHLKIEELSIYVVDYKKESGETVIRQLTEDELHEIYQYGIDIYYNLENYLMHEQQ